MAVTVELLEGLAGAAAVLLALRFLITFLRWNTSGGLARSHAFVVGSVLTLIAALSVSIGFLMMGFLHAGASAWVAFPASLAVHAGFFTAISFLTARRSGRPPMPGDAVA